MSEANAGVLYLVATPIGNLGDLSPRAIETLRAARRVAAEDTRHSRALLRHFGIATALESLHQHNEEATVGLWLARLAAGEDIALISDAGTPLLSDPGFPLVRAARAAGFTVSPVPGPCAAIAALTASGLPCDRFTFLGFPPRKGSARRDWLGAWRGCAETLILYESSHRIDALLADLSQVFPPDRPLVIARELTKRHETVHSTTVGEAAVWLAASAEQRLGEFVVLIGGKPPARAAGPDPDAARILAILMKSGCSVRDAANLAAEITGTPRRALYALALGQQATD